MQSVDPATAIGLSAARQQQIREGAVEVFEWFRDRYDSGDDSLVLRRDALSAIATDLGWKTDGEPDTNRANRALALLLTDVPDPVQQLAIDGDKYVGIPTLNIWESEGVYGIELLSDSLPASRKRVVCARCVETCDDHSDVITATEGEGRFGHFDDTPDAEAWQNLRNAVTEHIVNEHDTPPSDVEVAATLASPTVDKSGNTFWTAGNDGAGTGLNADLFDGLDGSSGSSGQVLQTDGTNLSWATVSPELPDLSNIGGSTVGETENALSNIFDESGWTADSYYGSGPAHGEGSDAFVGAALAPDGRIIFAPHASNNVGIFDPSDDSYTSGPSHGEGGSALNGAALAPDGRIIFAPFGSNNVGIFDPSNDSYTSGPSHGEGSNAHQGAALAPDGRIIFAPHDSNNVGIFDPSNDSYTSGPAHGEGANAFRGAALAPDGRIIFAPDNSSNVGIFDPSNDSYTSGPAHGEGDFAFRGAALAPDGRIIFAPFNTGNVGIFDPSDDSYTSGPSHNEGSFPFRGAALAPDGRIIFAPYDSSNVGIFDPSNDSYTSGPAHGEGDFAFRGAALAPDGRIIFAPHASSNVGILDGFAGIEKPRTNSTHPLVQTS